MKIKVTYMSRFYLVVVPSIIIISGFFFVPYLNYKYLVTDSTLIKLAANIGGFVLLIAFAIAIYPLMKKIASQKKAPLSLEGVVVSWRTGIKNKAIDLSMDHTALVNSGPGLQAPQNSTVYISGDKQSLNLTLFQMERHSVTDIVKNEDFIDTISVPAEEGTGGFNLDPHSDIHRNFFYDLLRLIWEYKDKNLAYEVHRLFPWDDDPNPDVSFARPFENESEVRSLFDRDSMKIGRYIWLIADYLIVDGEDNNYWLFPLGYTTAQTVSRTKTGGTSQALAFYDTIEFTGFDKSRKEIKIAIPEDPSRVNIEREVLMKRFMMRFVNSRYRG